jgi:hypothetical protein
MQFEDTKECKYCHRPLVKIPDCFALVEVGLMPGMVCKPCNALYESKEWLEALQRKKAYATMAEFAEVVSDAMNNPPELEIKSNFLCKIEHN